MLQPDLLKRCLLLTVLKAGSGGVELDKVKNMGGKDREHTLLCVYRMSTLYIFLVWSWLKTSFCNEYNILEVLMHLQE